MPQIYWGDGYMPADYIAVLEDWRDPSHPDPHERWLAVNLYADHRVSRERAREFDEYVDRGSGAPAIRNGIIDYFKEKVRDRTLPHYVYDRVNRKNLLTGGRLRKTLIPKDMRLARILDLNGLDKPYKWAKETRRPEFATFSGFPDIHDPATVSSWMDRQLNSRSAAGRRDFIALTLRILGEYGRRYPYQPTWAAAWRQLHPLLSDPPERWLQALGVARPWAGRWLVPLVYRVREAGTVARPTQLDAGWYACHFPSPPESEVRISAADGGSPMDLCHPPCREPLAEYVHKQMDHPIRHWEEAGSRLERTTSPVVGPTVAQRVAHHQKLRSYYGAGVVTWMPSAV